MKIRIFVTVIALALVSACAAFDDNGTPYEGFGPDVVAPYSNGGEFQGTYKGQITLTENSCANLAEEVGAKEDLTLDVIQSGELVSIAFEDSSESSGNIKDGKTVIVKREVSSTKIFDIEFTDTGMAGVCEYIDGAPVAGQLGATCAKYSIEMTKE